MKLGKCILVLICLLIALSCSKKQELKKQVLMESVNASYEPPPPPPPPPPAINQSSYNPKLVKKGDLTISSIDIESTKQLIFGFVKICNGYVINENLVANEPNSFYQISLNIQASQFDKFVHLLDSSKLNIVSRSFSVADVTMQYVDNVTRLENKKKLEKRYLDLLAKTKEIKDILEIEEKLENIRTEIEVKESQLKVLDKQIEYSEFNLKIEKRKVNISFDDTNKYSYKIGQGLISGWEGIKSFLIALISIWPIYLLIAILYYAIRGIIRKKKK
jgi:hypothetical protein